MNCLYVAPGGCGGGGWSDMRMPPGKFGRPTVLLIIFYRNDQNDLFLQAFSGKNPFLQTNLGKLDPFLGICFSKTCPYGRHVPVSPHTGVPTPRTCGTEIGCVNRCSIKSKNANTKCNQTGISYTFFYEKPSKDI